MELTNTQKELIEECKRLENGCLAVPMGMGKTRISLALATSYMGTIIIVVSKTLIGSWIEEITKLGLPKPFIYHSDFTKSKAEPTESIIITTRTMLASVYKKYNIASKFVHQSVTMYRGLEVKTNHYRIPKHPLCSETEVGGWLYNKTWDCLIIDEIQQYTNITTAQCHVISALHTKHRWGLSGTPFTEPTAPRILGYHILLWLKGFPDNLPETIKYIKSDKFVGVGCTMVSRKTVDYVLPPVTKEIVHHKLSSRELMICEEMRKITDMAVKESILNKESEAKPYLLALIIYARQFLVCPLLSVLALKRDVETKSNNIVMAMTNNVNAMVRKLGKWIEDPESGKSSRITKVLSLLEHHSEEKILVFTCFRSCADKILDYIPSERELFTIESKHSAVNRGKIIENYKKSRNGVFVLTFDIGAEGLNLQGGSVVILVDYWWNDGKSNQAIARLVRRGQTLPVQIYYLTSDTGLEKAIFNKHADKITVADELEKGALKSSIRSLPLDELLSIIVNSKDIKIPDGVLKSSKGGDDGLIQFVEDAPSEDLISQFNKLAICKRSAVHDDYLTKLTDKGL